MHIKVTCPLCMRVINSTYYEVLPDLDVLLYSNRGLVTTVVDNRAPIEGHHADCESGDNIPTHKLIKAYDAKVKQNHELERCMAKLETCLASSPVLAMGSQKVDPVVDGNVSVKSEMIPDHLITGMEVPMPHLGPLCAQARAANRLQTENEKLQERVKALTQLLHERERTHWHTWGEHLGHDPAMCWLCRVRRVLGIASTTQ